MNSLTRKLAAGVIAAAATLGLAGLGAVTATAADNASLTVNTTDAAYAGKTVNAYQMFTAEVNADGGATYKLNTAWSDFFTDQYKVSGNAGVCEKKTGTDLSDCAVNTVVALRGEDNAGKLAAFATQASNWAQSKKADNQANVSVTKSAKFSETASNSTYSATFATSNTPGNSLDFGYYLIAVPGATVIDANNKNATLLPIIKIADNTVNIKGTLPTVEKQVQKNDTDTPADSTTAKIGDELTFTLTSTIPDMGRYTTYKFNFVDTLSKGLTYKADSVSVVIKGAGANNTDLTLTKADGNDLNDYSVTDPVPGTGTGQNNNTLTVTMNNFAQKKQYAGKKIVVTYKATLNEDAESNTNTNTNEAKVEYTNDPVTEQDGSSEPDKVYVYTYKFGIKKYTMTGEGNNTEKTLSGAKFTLKPSGANAAELKFVRTTEGNATDASVYRLAISDNEQGATTTIETPESGLVSIEGLDKGNYVLTETEAPTGYSKLSNPYGVNVDGTAPTDGSEPTTTIKYNTDNSTTYNETASEGRINILNNVAPSIPNTGGMGTVLFTVFGVLIIALGTGWYVKSNRKVTK